MGFDVVFGMLLLLGALRGFRQGFAHQMVQVTGIVAGVFLAEPLAALTSPLAKDYLASLPAEVHLPLLSVAWLIMVSILIWCFGTWLLGWHRKRSVGENKPSLQDRVFGVSVGVAKAAAVVFVLIFALGLESVRSFMDRFEPVRLHYNESRAVALAQQFPLVSYVRDAPEVKRLCGDLAALVKYYRTRQPTEPQQAQQEARELR